MKFRPCIDIHNGAVKQIVGGSLQDEGDAAKENFVSQKSAAEYAKMYREDGVVGGHIILLNKKNSPNYEATLNQGLSALQAYPGGLQIGGGITATNAAQFLDAGASHVIVTSYLFQDGQLSVERLMKLADSVGKEHVVIDLSCRKKDGFYMVVTDRWQTFTKLVVDSELLQILEPFCDEFLIHGVDVEGKKNGMEAELVTMLSKYDGNPVTYAGGLHSMKAIEQFRELSGGKLDYTVGSALDIFGGKLEYKKLIG